ncbi:hypothetical protein GQX73_g10394 [Xylaria multiplex]|uniref:Uncharacterized protein n=1 Tax=Xylaria multiplex TaxID=323545 RepID=A0A7C8MXC2_9PEZI|nr:hypothetical protein GQX73_g10394 [Xylaria multiplex]
MDLPPTPRLPITQRIDKVLRLRNISEHVHVAVTYSGCSVECYKGLMELPATSTVQHTPSCDCTDPDATIVREYIRQCYYDGIGTNYFTCDELRTLQEVVHELCEELDPEGGPIEDVPDPREGPGGDGDMGEEETEEEGTESEETEGEETERKETEEEEELEG